MKHKLSSALSFLAILFLLAIGSESRAAGGQYTVYLPIVANHSFFIPPPIIPATTKTLPTTTTQYLSSVSPDGAVFTFSQTTPDLQSLNVGDIVAGEVASTAPNGFLRKVVSISMQGDQVIVTTLDTVLEEAIQQGGIAYNTTLSPVNVASSESLEGVMLAPDAGSFFININDVVLYDDDGNPDTTDDQIIANGSIEMEPGFHIAVSVRDFTLQELYFATSINETANVEISSIVTLASLEAEIELARYYFAPITIPIGGLPVIFTPVLVVNVGMDGSIHVGVTASATQEAMYTAGLEYRDNAWNLINNLDNSFQYIAPTLSAGMNAKAYASAELSLLLYGVVGPDAKAQAYLELEADLLATPWWILYGGLEVNVGVDIEILSHVVVSYEATVLDYRVMLAQAGDSGETWQEVGLGSGSGGGISNSMGGAYYPSLAIGSNGIPYAAWVDPNVEDSEIYVRFWNGSSWTEIGAGSASGGGISNNSGPSSFPTIAISPNNTPYVAWHDYDNGSAFEIYIRAWDGNNWVEVGSGSASGGGISNNIGNSSFPSIAVAPNGTPYVAWNDASSGNREIYVRAWNGSNWVEVGAGSANGGGISNNAGDSLWPSLIIAPDGTPYVAWEDNSGGNYEIYVRMWNGYNWVEVGAGSASNGGISNNIGDSSLPFILITPGGTPYVVWDDDNSGDREIYLRAWNGSIWAEVGVDSASGGGISNNIGNSSVSSIAISPIGTVYVVWNDDSNGDREIYVRAWNGSNWVEVATDSASNGGISSNAGSSWWACIAIDPDGTPYVAWQDDSGGDNEIYIRRYIE